MPWPLLVVEFDPQFSMLLYRFLLHLDCCFDPAFAVSLGPQFPPQTEKYLVNTYTRLSTLLLNKLRIDKSDNYRACKEKAVVSALASHHRVQIPASKPYVSWVCVVAWFVLCSERFFSGFSCFPPLRKNLINISKFLFHQEWYRRSTTTLNSLIIYLKMCYYLLKEKTWERVCFSVIMLLNVGDYS